MSKRAWFSVIAASIGIVGCTSIPDIQFDGPDASVADGGASGTGADGELDAPGDGSDCPAVCNGGCADGRCTIVGSGKADVTCPAGRGCLLKCPDWKACEGRLVCPSGASCTVDCPVKDACQNLTVEQNAAASICLRCTANQACNGIVCNASSECKKVCATSACNTTCGNCSSVSDCL